MSAMHCCDASVLGCVRLLCSSLDPTFAIELRSNVCFAIRRAHRHACDAYLAGGPTEQAVVLSLRAVQLPMTCVRLRGAFAAVAVTRIAFASHGGCHDLYATAAFARHGHLVAVGQARVPPFLLCCINLYGVGCVNGGPRTGKCNCVAFFRTVGRT
ncbi:hypothetical protein TRVL_05459 [Trypanosoma vivax]|nr:hypothetical protein TRVL_05459 [Trypanosoma vivax]